MSETIHLQINYSDSLHITKEYPAGISAEEIIEEYRDRLPYRILACRFNNVNVHLKQPLCRKGTLDLMDQSDFYANTVLQASFTLLYIKCVHDVLGKKADVTIANSLSKGLLTQIHNVPVEEDTDRKLSARMKELVEENLEIKEELLDRSEALAWLKENNREEQIRLFESAPELNDVYLCTLGDESDIFTVHLVPHTGLLNQFEIRSYRSGMLLRFTHFTTPDEVPEYVEERILYNAYSEELRWENLLEANYTSELNEAVKTGRFKELVLVSEALHERKIAEIASVIQKKKKRIILIAGPSSSGKTTFANRLCIQLQVLGVKTLYLGTDDYFINRADMIPDEEGKVDFEAISAVDIKLLADQIDSLLKGEPVDLPRFDFVSGKKVYGERMTSIPENCAIVLEGIHGLNPELTKYLDDDDKYRIYISPLTELNFDPHHRVPTSDVRMMRRMVRDHRTRGRSAEVTLNSWDEVRRGEEKNIFPFTKEADAFFNSSLIYEIPVLKNYAEPLLRAIPQTSSVYSEAQRMLKFLSHFVGTDDIQVINSNTILREFIGGSVLVDN